MVSYGYIVPTLQIQSAFVSVPPTLQKQQHIPC